MEAFDLAECVDLASADFMIRAVTRVTLATQNMARHVSMDTSGCCTTYKTAKAQEYLLSVESADAFLIASTSINANRPHERATMVEQLLGVILCLIIVTALRA